LIAGREVFEDEEIEDKSTPSARSPKPMERVEPDVGAKEFVPEPVETAASAKDITRD